MDDQGRDEKPGATRWSPPTSGPPGRASTRSRTIVEESGWKSKRRHDGLHRDARGHEFQQSLDFPSGDKHFRPEDHLSVKGIWIEQVTDGDLDVPQPRSREPDLRARGRPTAVIPVGPAHEPRGPDLRPATTPDTDGATCHAATGNGTSPSNGSRAHGPARRRHAARVRRGPGPAGGSDGTRRRCRPSPRRRGFPAAGPAGAPHPISSSRTTSSSPSTATERAAARAGHRPRPDACSTPPATTPPSSPSWRPCRANPSSTRSPTTASPTPQLDGPARSRDVDTLVAGRAPS